MARRRSKGAAGIRRLFRNLPDAARNELGDILEKGSRSILANMIRRAPRGRTGKLRRGLKYKVSRTTLTARIGLMGPPKERNRLFYALILDRGRKAQTAKAVRRRPGGGVSRYLVRVKAFAGIGFVTGQYPELRKTMGQNLRGAWDRILRRIAGAGRD